MPAAAVRRRRARGFSRDDGLMPRRRGGAASPLPLAAGADRRGTGLLFTSP